MLAAVLEREARHVHAARVSHYTADMATTAAERKLLIGGEWVASESSTRVPVVDPATGMEVASVADANAADVDKAVRAAQAAFETYGRTSREERIALLERVIAAYTARLGEMAETISLEMGAPMWLAKAAHAPAA